jgi:hypothetical protein
MKTTIIFSIFFLLLGKDAHHIIVCFSSGDIRSSKAERSVDRLSRNLKVKNKTTNVEYNLFHARICVKIAHPFQEVAARKLGTIHRYIAVCEDISEARHLGTLTYAEGTLQLQ